VDSFLYSLEQLTDASNRLMQAATGLKVWIFKGEMGAGKTTLIKAIANQLGVIDSVQSPTFSLINEYSTKHKTAVFHFDFYRIKNEVEAFDIGVEDYFYSGHICLVEWPEKIPSLLPEAFFEIAIQLTENQLRQIHYTRHE
jgi:tRNA threonylcarbamoyladenosine biosynthesis protein TsaE